MEHRKSDGSTKMCIQGSSPYYLLFSNIEIPKLYKSVMALVNTPTITVKSSLNKMGANNPSKSNQLPLDPSNSLLNSTKDVTKTKPHKFHTTLSSRTSPKTSPTMTPLKTYMKKSPLLISTPKYRLLKRPRPTPLIATPKTKLSKN